MNLSTARDRQSVVAQATYADGLTRDVTAEAVIAPANPALLRRDGATFYPVADGATTLAVSFAGQTVTVPVKVEHAAVDPPLSFRLDVMPVFMKAGCNTGQLPRRRAGQGRVPALPLRVRPGRRPLPAHPRDERPADQPGRPRREHADGEVRRRRAAHRRQAVRVGSEVYKTLHRWIEAVRPTTT